MKGSMSPYRRSGSPYFYVRRNIKGLGELRLSTQTTSEATARRYDELLKDLRDLGKMEVLAALRSGQLTLRDVYQNRSPAKLDQLLAARDTRLVMPLLDEWLSVGATDTGIRERSMQRYRTSWNVIREVLRPDARLADLNQEFVSCFKRHRRTRPAPKPPTAATLNRDLAAIGAFLSWCEKEKGLKVQRPVLEYQRESAGRMRYLTREELDAFRASCPAEWWPLFGLLFLTGITVGEALGLRRADLDLRSRRVSIHEAYGRQLKRRSRARELSVPEGFVPTLASWLDRVDSSPEAKVFDFTYWPARKAFNRVCKRAGLHDVRVHDARHTFAVHAVQNGVPEARLQHLLGHSHPGTTRRYARHAPEQFVQRDAETVAASMGWLAAPLRMLA